MNLQFHYGDFIQMLKFLFFFKIYTYMIGVGMSDGKLNVLRQVAYWQICNTTADYWTDPGLVV